MVSTYPIKQILSIQLWVPNGHWTWDMDNTILWNVYYANHERLLSEMKYSKRNESINIIDVWIFEIHHRKFMSIISWLTRDEWTKNHCWPNEYNPIRRAKMPQNITIDTSQQQCKMNRVKSHTFFEWSMAFGYSRIACPLPISNETKSNTASKQMNACVRLKHATHSLVSFTYPLIFRFVLFEFVCLSLQMNFHRVLLTGK